jgi:hypothetical protein
LWDIKIKINLKKGEINMKKILSILVLVCILTGFVNAGQGQITFKPWIGYSSFNMKDVSSKLVSIVSEDFAEEYDSLQDDIDDYYDTSIWYKNISLDSDTKELLNKKSKSGNMAGLDLSYNFNENILAGLRMSYTQASDVKYSQQDTIFFNYDDASTWISGVGPSGWERKENTYIYKYDCQVKNISLLPVMIGGSYKKNIADRFSVNGEAYVGYGFAKGTLFKHLSMEYIVSTDGVETYNDNIIYDAESSYMFGGAIVSDLSIGGEYEFTKVLSLGCNVGYRLAKISRVRTADKTVRMDFDFSGLIATLGLNCKF